MADSQRGDPLEEIEWQQPTTPRAEPFRTLLGESGTGPEAEYRSMERDATGSAALWTALEGYAPRAQPVTSSSEERSAIVASWAVGAPIPRFAHRHGDEVVDFERVGPSSADPSEGVDVTRVVLLCPICAQVVLILREP